MRQCDTIGPFIITEFTIGPRCTEILFFCQVHGTGPWLFLLAMSAAGYVITTHLRHTGLPKTEAEALADPQHPATNRMFAVHPIGIKGGEGDKRTILLTTHHANPLQLQSIGPHYDAPSSNHQKQ